ncbi:MAG: hypothetical protein M1540_01880 [Candidatus Bathyarchaeota archaeon]|nr:hypothetical protein [Chloroflexota bacterium]MCL5876545.1 hypothetical protein [Candidatus Bathyarchaeota archaeon]
MAEKSIQERGKETLKWIQKEQKASGLGMVESAKVPDQGAMRFLLRLGDVFEPQQGMIKSSVEPEPEESASESGTGGLVDHAPWVWKTPKPKRKGDVPEPYEFLAYPEWSVLPSAVAEALRGMGFAGDPYLYEGYSYRKMAGGALRRKMIGTHSKEELLAELKLTCASEEEWVALKREIEEKVAEYRGRYKECPEVLVCEGIVFYPKDGSFRFTQKDA